MDICSSSDSDVDEVPVFCDLSEEKINALHLRERVAEGSTCTQLGLVQRLLEIQSARKLAEGAVDDMIQLMNDVFGCDTMNYRKAKQLVEDHCLLGARTYDACVNDHILFYNSPYDKRYQFDSVDITQCPTCGEARYDKRSGKARKQFFYIPLRDILSAVFSQEHLVNSFIRTASGELPHGGDMRKIWKDITDSPGYEHFVHGLDPDFGRSWRNLVRNVIAVLLYICNIICHSYVYDIQCM
jgi:hypothetical protein